jgi:hypothetical protein
LTAIEPAGGKASTKFRTSSPKAVESDSKAFRNFSYGGGWYFGKRLLKLHFASVKPSLALGLNRGCELWEPILSHGALSISQASEDIPDRPRDIHFERGFHRRFDFRFGSFPVAWRKCP